MKEESFHVQTDVPNIGTRTKTPFKRRTGTVFLWTGTEMEPIFDFKLSLTAEPEQLKLKMVFRFFGLLFLGLILIF